MNISGFWHVSQTNHHDITLNIGTLQPDGRFSATGRQVENSVVGSGFGSVRADESPEKCVVRIEWENKTVGVYIGQMNQAGQLVGAGFDERNPSSVTGFTATRQ